MNKSLLDTDTLSEVLKGRNLGVAERTAEYQSTVGPFTISAITVMEVVRGFQRAGRGESLQKFLSDLEAIEVLPFDRICA